METSTNRYFQRLSLISLVAVYFLIFVGGVVRSTGSGMGCPDWPKCFGSWVPPTSEDQLPNNYKEVYSEKRVKKNERFASYLQFFGYQELANNILLDESIKTEQDFNASKTWVEYVNRLIGALTGLFIFLLFVSAISLFKHHKRLFWISFAALIAVGFQGWIGSIVVSTNLTAWIITVHMLLAILILCLLIYIYVNRKGIQPSREAEGSYRFWILLILFFMLVQIVLGTQVREAIDVIASQFQSRGEWIDQLSWTFYIHRSFSLVILVAHLWFYRKLYLVHKGGEYFKMVQWVAIFIVLEVLSGVGMAYGSVPAILQPIHLVLSVLIFGFLYQAYLLGARKSVLKEI